MGLVFVLLMSLADTPTPSVSAYPHFSNAPADVRVTARFRAAPREWCVAISADDSSFERASCEATENPPLSVTLWFRAVPAGHYTATVRVLYPDMVVRVARDTFCVSGFDISCGEVP